MAETARQMRAAEHAPAAWEIALADEAATHALGRYLADELEAGDMVGLSGGLGSGKTTLARAIIRALAGDEALEVPSPTFTLMQRYETPRGPVVHADLYRIGDADELREVGFEEAADAGIILVEWPERAASALRPRRLEIALDLASGGAQGARSARLTGSGGFVPRLARMQALRELLAKSGWADARRVPLQGDASTRSYERLVKPSGETAMLMISPARTDGPPVRRGKPYSAIAKLAESVHAFVALDRGLRALGFSAPRIYGEDLDAGLVILEDLGAAPVTDADGPIPDRYEQATRLLAKLHATSVPPALPVADGREHVLQPYDLDAFLIEVELLLDWYAPHIPRTLLPESARADFVNLWTGLLEPLLAGPQTWTLRDYHSPNLIWLAERDDTGRVGLLDFQDAVLGPPAYDVASLLQDARVTVPAELELKLLGAYARERRGADAGFDMTGFATAYAIMAAQRATKVLGIFARLDKRDGKPQYLAHLPRIESYLARNLAHPALSRLKGWYEQHLPRILERG
jgi:tRNA threonylcarbamoyl adenosine modification protein YjeE